MRNIQSNDDTEHAHHATNTKEILKQEADANQVMDVFSNNFMNPFNMEDEGLYIVSSGKESSCRDRC